MPKLMLWSILVSFLLLLPSAGAQGIRIMVTYRDDSFIAEALELAQGNRLNLNITARNILAFTVKDTEIFQRIIDNPKVEFAEVDGIQEALVFGGFNLRDIEDLNEETPSRDFERVPYGIPHVQADQLREIPPIDALMPVCVVDTGMNLGHKDLPQRFENEVTGTSTESGTWFQDGDGHGTHTAGTIGAVGNNSIGVGLSDDGSGFESAILAAVQGCVDRGAQVVSMSLGGPSKTNTAKKFYRDVWDEGILIIAAAGNSGNTGNLYPASYKHVMSVAAIDSNNTRPDFSQCNDQVEISAPGVDVLSTVPNGYAVASGTSMACPHVAGVAAEIWSRFPDCTNNQIRNVLLRSSLPIGPLEGCNRGYGSGLVQAKAAYDLLVAEGCSAGGEAQADPEGGCKQNPAYDKNNNPHEKDCPSAGNRFDPPGIALLTISSLWPLFIYQLRW